jgi:hypothetical protein
VDAPAEPPRSTTATVKLADAKSAPAARRSARFTDAHRPDAPVARIQYFIKFT